MSSTIRIAPDGNVMSEDGLTLEEAKKFCLNSGSIYRLKDPDKHFVKWVLNRPVDQTVQQFHFCH